MTMPLLMATVTVDGCRPGIGDPTVLGWATVAAYLLAAALCRMAGRAENRLRRQGEQNLRPGFWWSLGIVMLLLAVNKQLDLQSLFTVIGRRLAKEQGWYGRKREYQLVFIYSVATIGLLVLTAGMRWIRTRFWRYSPALAGFTFTVCFVIIRAASFHHVDHLLGVPLVSGVRANVILEVSGISLVVVTAWAACAAQNSAGGRERGNTQERTER